MPRLESPGAEGTGRTPGRIDAHRDLKAAGLKATVQRLAVLDALDAHPHADADAVHRAVSDTLRTSLQAVYVVLTTLADAGLVRRIEPAGSSSLWELRVGDNHHHVVCRACGAVADVECATRAAPCLSPSDTHGFAVDAAEVVYWGRCADCLASGALPVADPESIPTRRRRRD